MTENNNTQVIPPLTEEERRELEAAARMPIVFDEDCPETTPERAIRFRRVNPPERHPPRPA